MTFKTRIVGQSTTGGTGTLTLTGTSPTGYREPSATGGFSVGQSFKAVIYEVDANGQPTGEWEECTATLATSSTITRASVTASTNAGALVNFTASTNKYIICTPSATQFESWENLQPIYPVTASGTNSYSITPTPAITAYAANQTYWVVFTNANTSTTNTLQISGVATPPSIVKLDSTGAYVALAVGDIIAGHVGLVRLASTTQAVLLNPKPAASSGASTSANNTWTKAQRGSITALTDGATITPDFSDNNFYSVTLGGNRTLANPTNIVAGQSGSIFITQDGTGSRTLAYGSYFKFPFGSAPTLTTTASAVDRLDYVVESTTRIHASLTKGVA